MNTPTTETLYEQLGISKEVWAFGQKTEEKLKERFEEFDRNAEYNQLKVIHAMQENRVSEGCFNYVSGYGYNDQGRDTLEDVYASVFHTEAALVRPQITCGTHALALALAANLRPGDTLLSPVGKPYDTLEEVIGIRPSNGSLAEYGISYKQVELLEDGYFDYPAIEKALEDKTIKLATIQRSKGYQTRPSFSVKQIGELISFVKSIKPDVICMVDNCYGEFVEEKEPTDVGADILVGSLMKNLGAGIATSGAYIVGKKDLIELCAERLTAPGVGKEIGPSLNQNILFIKGLFFSPSVVVSAVKTAVFASRILEKLGYKVDPLYNEKRADIVQTIELGDADKLVKFCQGIQMGSPIDSNVIPEPSAMGGYDDQVIMAAGTFTEGSTIELSCDGPIRAPYIAYMQGGLTYQYGKLGIMKALSNLE